MICRCWRWNSRQRRHPACLNQNCAQSHENGRPRSALCCRSLLRACQLRREGRWPGVRSPAHARGAPVVVCAAQRHQHQPRARRARTPRMGPATVPRATCPGTQGGRQRGANPTTVAQGGGGAAGRGPHSRCPGSSHAWTVMTRLSVAGLDAAPRAWAGARGRRHRPGAQSSAGRACTNSRFSLAAPDHLTRAGAGMRAATNDSQGPNAAGTNDAVKRECVWARARHRARRDIARISAGRRRARSRRAGCGRE